MSDKEDIKNSFFEFDDDEIKTDIALSKEELFSIIDQSEQKDLMKRKNDDLINGELSIEEHIPIDRENFGDKIAVFSVDELHEEYKKKRKSKYFIEDKESEKESFKHNSERNSLLDKFSEVKTNDILNTNEKTILDDDLEIIESDEENTENTKTNHDRVDNNKEISNYDEIQSVISYIDELLETLPQEKIDEFMKTEYYALYKKVTAEINK